MQASFLRRLLRGDLEVKGCLESDISAAYLDLRHLSLEQLLSLKMLNLDFATASESHTAHSNFLEALEAQIAARLFAAPSATSDLGRRLLLVLGACTLLGEGWGSSSGHLPDCWALPIPPRGAALFRVSSLQVQTDMSQVQWPESPVAIVKDTSFGPCRARRFQWEITTVDPGVDDVVAAANAASNASHAQNDLVKALAARVVKGSPLDALKEVPRPLRSKACWPPACRQPTRLPRKSLELTAGKVRQSLERLDRGSISPG
ncbi:unnamed protein product [Effrenium voratum]|nr:unnamed protein product [Effrenium voratum]